MEELRVLGQRSPVGRHSSLPARMAKIASPLRTEVWADMLKQLPDKECAEYLLRGLSEGFRIGYEYETQKCRSARNNMQSALENPQVVDQYIQQERSLGRVLGPIDPDSCGIQVNRFGVIPKGNQPGKWRLILDLSHPEGYSVNEGIEPSLCSLSYISVDHAARMALALGRGTLLAKLDLESAYRMIPVHPDDRPLLGMKWRGQYLVDAALPFGLRSAPKLFNLVADCLQWIFRQHDIMVIHYLDDFLLVGPPQSNQCYRTLQTSLGLCEQLGVKVALRKLEGPATALAFLGILLDTEKLELRLPDDKLVRLKGMVSEWKQRRHCTKRELLSLIGCLHHACQVVPAGRSFLRRMIELSKRAKQLHHHLRLNVEFRSDLEWWHLFLPEWNGVSMMTAVGLRAPSITVTSDASGSWGCGAFTARGRWFQYRWPSSWSAVGITVKELLPIVFSCAIWGRGWQGKQVQCYSDNAAVVAVINAGRSKDRRVMHLLRSLFFFMARDKYSLYATHVEGRLNVAADALSRNKLSVFRRQVPHAERQPSIIPAELEELLVLMRPDWISPGWRRRFRAISRKV